MVPYRKTEAIMLYAVVYLDETGIPHVVGGGEDLSHDDATELKTTLEKEPPAHASFHFDVLAYPQNACALDAIKSRYCTKGGPP
jgi:hypothetical protein